MTNLVNRLHKRGHRFQIIVLTIGLSTITTVWLISKHIPYAKLAGYPGVLLLSFMGSASMVVPIPGLLSLCGFSLTLSPLLLGVLAGIGETVGEISGYTIGYGGSPLIQKRSFYSALRRLMEKHGIIILFLLSIVPNPIFDVVGYYCWWSQISTEKIPGHIVGWENFKGHNHRIYLLLQYE